MKQLGALMLSAAIILGACATKSGPDVVVRTIELPASIPATDACKIFGPIIYSYLHDTAETINNIEEHNAVWDAVCEPAQD